MGKTKTVLRGDLCPLKCDETKGGNSRAKRAPQGGVNSNGLLQRSNTE